MDEFEFKPLTQGLGFHKKSITLKEESKTASASTSTSADIQSTSTRPSDNFFSKALDTNKDYNSRPLEDLMQSFPKMDGLDFLEEDLAINTKAPQKARGPIVNNPLPRNDLKNEITTREKKQINPIDLLQWREPELKIAPEVFQTPMQSALVPATAPLVIPDMPKVVAPKKATVTQTGFRTASPKVSAYLIDLLVMVGLTNIFMAAVLFVTKVDVIFVLSHPQTSFITKLSVVVLFYVLALMYQMVARAIAGRTLGEWTADLQLGTSEQQAKTLYPVRVVYRSLLNTFMGIIVLPIGSVLLGKDFLAISGLELHRKED